MCYSPSPPPSSKAIFSSNLNFGNKCSSDHINVYDTTSRGYNINYIVSNNKQDNMQRTEDIQIVNDTKTDEETPSDYKQWLHAMKLVARLPGGIPPEFRRKLWLSLADKYLKSKNVDWNKEQEKCFQEKLREDDEELGIQIVKDLHRTGSTLCTGPAGDLNQAKLKRILLGYTRYNPEVGYCQGFNMLGALILQVMDKDESESIKVMIYLVEGILPAGYFCGSMGGLQADMAVFRDLMQTKLPRLAKHLQKLQGPIENAYEPPLTNVFTMQWFLTLFCTCLPMSCVLRVWDLVLIEGSDVLLRTSLALWSLLEERVLSARSADDFYGKMGSFSSELLNGHLIDSNGLIEKVVQLGPITDIKKLRDKHLCNIAPIERQQGLQLYFDDDEPDTDENSRLAVATVWGTPWGRRGSHGQQNNNITKQTVENKDRIALDISLLKKQYDKLRERQKQAQIILTTACSSASRQNTTNTTPLPVNQLLSGRPAIVTNKGRRCGPPTGAIPPARKPSLPAVLHDRPLEKQFKRGETLLWRDTEYTKCRRDSLSWKEIKAERASLVSSGSIDGLKSQKIRTSRLGKSDSSSYSEESEESDDNDNNKKRKNYENHSSTDTSLENEDLQAPSNGKKNFLNIKNNNKSYTKNLHKTKNKNSLKQRNHMVIEKNNGEKARPKSWAPSNSDIPFVLMTTDSPTHSIDGTSIDNMPVDQEEISKLKNCVYPNIPDDKVITAELEPTIFNKRESITPTDISFLVKTISLAENNGKDNNIETFDISNEGVTNEYFERVNSTERPTKLDLFYSLNEDEPIRDVLQVENEIYTNYKSSNKNINTRCMDLLVDYSEKSSVACIQEAKTEISGFKNESVLRKTKTSADKRRDPRRLTLTRSSTMNEKRSEAFEKRFSMEICTNYTKFSDETEFDTKSYNIPHQDYAMNSNKTNNENEKSEYNDSCHKASLPENTLPDKKIPSTADLEERFENIRQQLVRDRNRTNGSPCDSEDTEAQAKSKASPNSNIPSNSQKGKTKNQENKHGSSGSGEEIEIEVLNKNSDFKEKSSASEKFEDVKKSSCIQDSQSCVVDTSTSTTLKMKLVQKKKEPPDLDSKKDNIETESLNGSDATATEENTSESQKTSVQLGDKSEKSLQDDSAAIYEANEQNLNESTKTTEHVSPPSTEELEKRFSALEEKFNSAKHKSKIGPNVVLQNESTEAESTLEIVDEDSKTNIEILSKVKKELSQTKANVSTNLISAEPKTNLAKFKTETSTQRRLSEPPSTEDLEKRFEVLKRRMSSRNFETKPFQKEIFSVHSQNTRKTMENANSTKENTSMSSSSKNSPPTLENLEERFKKLHTKNEVKDVVTLQTPPSTENLEERFEKLQNKNEDESFENQPETYKTSVKPQDSSIEQEGITLIDNNQNQDRSNTNRNEITTSMNNSYNKSKLSEDNIKNDASAKDKKKVAEISEEKKTQDLVSKNSNKIKIKLIEELQAKIKEHSFDSNVNNGFEKKMAVIEELKTKIKPLPDKFLKPSQVSAGRRPPSQILSLNDETLESRATSANLRSEKCEPTSSYNRKLVRRFSDLPSRADLENRLQFLEEQLSKTVRMQRRASDSEVASLAQFKNKPIVSSTQSNDNLEYRVQELEKRLKDKRTIAMDVECASANDRNDTDIEISQVELATDAGVPTGKELVRYSSHGEIGDIEHQNPINISINIQMTLNKEDIGMKTNAECSKTDYLDKRLQILEQRFKTSLVQDEFKTDADNHPKSSDREDKKENLVTETSAHEKENDENQIVKDGLSETEGECGNIDFSSADQSSPVNRVTKNKTLSENNIDKRAEHFEICLKKGSIAAEIKQTSDEIIEENKHITTTECEKSDVDKKPIKETEIKEIKEEKGVKVDKPEIETKENEKFEQTKNESIITNTTENNSKDDKNIINSFHQKPQAQCNEKTVSVEVIQFKENSRSPDKKIESKSKCLLDDKEINKVVQNIETKSSEQLEKCIGLNKGLQYVPGEVNKKTLVLLLDNEPKTVKVRRLTRANTEELEDLFQALEKQLNNRGQQKDIKMDTDKKSQSQSEKETLKAMSDLGKEIEDFSKTNSNKTQQNEKLTQTKQIKQEEEFDWGIDPIKHHLKRRTVHLPSTKELEARFRSLERQIKLLEDVEKINVEHRLTEIERKIKLQYSLSHEKDLNKFLELCEGKDPDEYLGLENSQDRKECCNDHKQNVQTNFSNLLNEQNNNTCTPDLKRSKSKQSLKKQPIHPLEMLLDPTPDEEKIPTTGELEHRIRIMEEKRCTTSSSPSRKSRSQSPPIKQIKSKCSTFTHEKSSVSPTQREIPSAEELEARLEALEREKSFNFKMQKDFQQFNQKLKDVVSPSLSFDEFKTSAKTSDSVHIKGQACSTSKQAKNLDTVSPKIIRFYEEDTEAYKKKQYVKDKEVQQISTVREGLGVMGIRLMKETSPLRRKGTYTGITLRTGENINDQLTSIQNTIKSIDSLCEEKPYRKEKCQKYIDSLFAQKKSSLEDLTSRNIARSTSREIGPTIQISDHSPVFTRSMGSADSIHSTSQLQYRSNRDIRREHSPRRRREEDREEHESRVRRDNLFPNNINYSHSRLSHTSHSSLTKFHKVDSQLIPNDVEVENKHEHEESFRQPTNSTIDNLIYHDNTNTSNNINTTSQRIFNAGAIASNISNNQTLERPQSLTSTSNTPVYTPAKLEIRHTTVTSTFYDRVLTEKQLEKKHHLSFSTSNRSPMISPQFEKNVKFISNQQTTKSPTKLFAFEAIN